MTEKSLPAKTHLRSLDALKGLAILLAVTIGHYWQFTPASYYAGGDNVTMVNITNFVTQRAFHTYPLMELLFMISGFQMYSYYLRISNGEIDFVPYITRRIKRLFPLAGISTLVMTLGLFVYFKMTETLWHDLAPEGSSVFKSLLLIQNWNRTDSVINGPLWFMSVLFFCIIIFYPLSRLASKFKNGIVVMFIPFILGIILYDHGSNLIFLNQLMCRGYLGFFAGVITAHIGTIIPKKRAIIGSLIILGVFVPYAILFSDYLNHSKDLLSRSLPAVIMCFAPLLTLTSRSSTVDALIGNPLFYSLGRISFCLYVTNLPFYLWLEIINLSFKLNIPYGDYYMYWIIALIAIAFATLVHFLVEIPIRKRLLPQTTSKKRIHHTR